VLFRSHGATSDRSRWRPVLPALEARFTVFAMDRRGRGASTDAPQYSLEREVADVAAMVDSIGGPVDVLAHSYGAICALEATRATRNVRRLVLYEPPVAVPGEDGAMLAATIEEIERHLGRNDPAAALTAFYARNLRMPEAEIDRLRAAPSWPARLAIAPTLPRELREARRYRFDAAAFRNYSTPTLLILGGDSAPRHREATSTLQSALAGSKVAVLAGHKHVVMDTGPELFAATVLDFFARN